MQAVTLQIIEENLLEMAFFSHLLNEQDKPKGLEKIVRSAWLLEN
jgi:hypothetical protein